MHEQQGVSMPVEAGQPTTTRSRRLVEPHVRKAYKIAYDVCYYGGSEVASTEEQDCSHDTEDECVYHLQH